MLTPGRRGTGDVSATHHDKENARPVDFEKSLEKLERVIAKLEEPNLPLEESVRQFERGVTLLRECQQALDQAEQKVKILTGKQPGAEMEPLEKREEKRTPQDRGSSPDQVPPG